MPKCLIVLSKLYYTIFVLQLLASVFQLFFPLQVNDFPVPDHLGITTITPVYFWVSIVYAVFATFFGIYLLAKLKPKTALTKLASQILALTPISGLVWLVAASTIISVFTYILDSVGIHLYVPFVLSIVLIHLVFNTLELVFISMIQHKPKILDTLTLKSFKSKNIPQIHLPKNIVKGIFALNLAVLGFYFVNSIYFISGQVFSILQYINRNLSVDYRYYEFMQVAGGLNISLSFVSLFLTVYHRSKLSPRQYSLLLGILVAIIVSNLILPMYPNNFSKSSEIIFLIKNLLPVAFCVVNWRFLTQSQSKNLNEVK